MTQKYVLTGAKIFATLTQVFSAGVQYSAGQLGSAVEEKSPTGVPYFTLVDDTEVAGTVASSDLTVTDLQEAGAVKGSPVNADASVPDQDPLAPPPAPEAPQKAGKTISVGKKSSPPADTVTV